MEVAASPGITFLPWSYDWPTTLGTSFGMLKETASGGVALSPSMILVCRGQGRPRQYILAIWILFVRPQTFLPPRHEPWARYEMGRVPKSFGPTIAPQNPAVRLLGRGGGFWCSRAYVRADRVLFPCRRQGLFACPRHAPSVSAYKVRCH